MEKNISIYIDNYKNLSISNYDFEENSRMKVNMVFDILKNKEDTNNDGLVELPDVDDVNLIHSCMKAFIMRVMYKKYICWAREINPIINDALVLGTFHIHEQLHTTEDCERYCENCKTVIDTLRKHLAQGRELGLNSETQLIADALWAQAPHPYSDNLISCANRIYAKVRSIKIKKGIKLDNYIATVENIIKDTRDVYKVYYNNIGWDVSVGYLLDWAEKRFYNLTNEIKQQEKDNDNGKN